MRVVLDPHAVGRAADRGCTVEEIEATVREGERFPARFGRTGFRRAFSGLWRWRGREFDTKEIEAYAVEQPDGWLVITVISRFYRGAS